VINCYLIFKLYTLLNKKTTPIMIIAQPDSPPRRSLSAEDCDGMPIHRHSPLSGDCGEAVKKELKFA